MAAQIIDGFSIAQNVRAGVGEKVKELQAQGVIPCLAVVLVGENPASQIYVRNKKKTAEKLGINSLSIEYPADISEKELVAKIDEYMYD